MKPGFSLIEVLVATAISSILAYSIYSVFFQVQKMSKLVERFVGNDAKVLIFQNQFEKDVSGAFVPEYWFKKSGGPAMEQEKPAAPAKPQDKIPQQNAPKKENKSVIEKAFVALNEGENLKDLVFISCNPFQVYKSSRPRIVRVSYRLVQQDDKTFSLFRKESLELDYSKFQKDNSPEYLILDRIKSFSLEFIYPEKQNPEPNSQPGSQSGPQVKSEPKPQEPEEVKFKTVKEWSQKLKEQDKNVPDIPKYVELKFSVYDASLTYEDYYEVRYEIFAFNQLEIREQRSKSAPKPEDKKPGDKKPEDNKKPEAKAGAATGGAAGANGPANKAQGLKSQLQGLPAFPNAGGMQPFGGIR